MTSLAALMAMPRTDAVAGPPAAVAVLVHAVPIPGPDWDNDSCEEISSTFLADQGQGSTLLARFTCLNEESEEEWGYLELHDSAALYMVGRFIHDFNGNSPIPIGGKLFYEIENFEHDGGLTLCAEAGRPYMFCPDYDIVRRTSVPTVDLMLKMNGTSSSVEDASLPFTER